MFLLSVLNAVRDRISLKIKTQLQKTTQSLNWTYVIIIGFAFSPLYLTYSLLNITQYKMHSHSAGFSFWDQFSYFTSWAVIAVFSFALVIFIVQYWRKGKFHFASDFKCKVDCAFAGCKNEPLANLYEWLRQIKIFTVAFIITTLIDRGSAQLLGVILVQKSFFLLTIWIRPYKESQIFELSNQLVQGLILHYIWLLEFFNREEWLFYPLVFLLLCCLGCQFIWLVMEAVRLSVEEKQRRRKSEGKQDAAEFNTCSEDSQALDEAVMRAIQDVEEHKIRRSYFGKFNNLKKLSSGEQGDASEDSESEVSIDMGEFETLGS